MDRRLSDSVRPIPALRAWQREFLMVAVTHCDRLCRLIVSVKMVLSRKDGGGAEFARERKADARGDGSTVNPMLTALGGVKAGAAAGLMVADMALDVAEVAADVALAPVELTGAAG